MTRPGYDEILQRVAADDDIFNGPRFHAHPPIPLRQLIVMLAVAAFIGFALAVTI